jgi:2-succinyl-5-enolpyruvyl-6-hydroxy-3-cyclohexene-1-carboxylate synthase
MSGNEALTKYAGAFIDELAKSGVKKIVISPGSRSTPLALLAMEHPDLDCYVLVDERSAAFFAMGAAKAGKEPVAILCTSGTAAANYFPAVIEACLSRVPLVVITADRPHELRDVGAPQTIDQVRLYGNFVKWFQDLPLAEVSGTMLKFVRTVSARAVHTAKQNPAGPVHINFPLREPLLPEEDFFSGEMPAAPRVVFRDPVMTLDEREFAALSSRLPEKGLFICGPMEMADDRFFRSLLRLAEALHYPVLADPLSQLRSRAPEHSPLVDSYDAFLRNPDVRRSLKPELIIRFGAMPVSKALHFYLQEHGEVPQWVVDSGRGFRDPAYGGSEWIYCDESVFCEEMLKHPAPFRTAGEWEGTWKSMNARAKKIMAEIGGEEGIAEGKIFYHLPEFLPDHAALYVGNSMPIRDMDSFFFACQKPVRVYGNRGASGIDGVVSSAMGASLFHPHTYLLIGDLSFYHDLNGLLAAKLYGLNLTVVLINNNGGGIFSLLPQAERPKHFEALFGTPTDLDFKHAARLYGAYYACPETWEEFCGTMAKVRDMDGLKIVEVHTCRKRNAAIRKGLWAKVSRKIAGLPREDGR